MKVGPTRIQADHPNIIIALHRRWLPLHKIDHVTRDLRLRQ